MSAKPDNVAQMKMQKMRRSDPTWTDDLRRRGDGFVGDECNVLHALRAAPELAGLVRFNEFSLNVEFTRSPHWRTCAAGTKWEESDDTALIDWLQGQQINVTRKSAVTDTVLLAARDHAVHPVREYLEGVLWDGVPRLGTWPVDYLGASGSPPYLAAVGRRFMVSAVARIMRPGCQADHVLVLEGDQGIGKTSAARAIAKRSDWFAGNLPDIHSKDAQLLVIGRWIIEIAELKAVRNSQIEATKSFITETHDTFRPPYGRRTAQFPRQCVFIATTNESEYLRDRTGNRRYWPVKCGRINVAALIRDRDQLWAEAVHAFRAGTAWHLTESERALANDEQSARVFITELETDVAAYLKNLRDGGTVETSIRDVLVYGLRLDTDAPGYVETARKLGSAVAEAMELAGWRKDRRARTAQGQRTLYRFAVQGVQGK